jgi:thymidylate synthase
MNKLDKDYCALLQDILDNGVTKKDRTGTGTISVFGRQIRHKMSDGFPLITTKKMYTKGIITELLWFLRGDTNIKYLIDNDCHIWDGDCYQAYVKKRKHSIRTEGGRSEIAIESLEKQLIYTQEEFINKIKTDDEFAKTWGDLGPIYGKQWRSWDSNKNLKVLCNGYTQPFILGWELKKDEYGNTIDDRQQIDQITNLINDLKTNPDSRRLMVSAWNVGELDQMVLPPCHYGFQVYTRELSLEDRYNWYINIYNKNLTRSSNQFDMDEILNSNNVPTRAISLMWNQRSVDTFLGLPFNIASYGLLLEIIAKEVNMVPDELIGNLGDTHLYLNHIEQAKEQIGREMTIDERMGWWFENNKPNRNVCDYVDLLPNNSKHIYFDEAKVSKRTREPFPLPTLKILDTKVDDIGHYEITDFILENYQSHPSIKAPLSN